MFWGRWDGLFPTIISIRWKTTNSMEWHSVPESLSWLHLTVLLFYMNKCSPLAPNGQHIVLFCGGNAIQLSRVSRNATWMLVLFVILWCDLADIENHVAFLLIHIFCIRFISMYGSVQYVMCILCTWNFLQYSVTRMVNYV